ncbi:MAG: hypothetical protein IIV27_10400, partial [Clostridia bacterium]|nr:hypothetical protein [Clostridia bacterium]
PAENARPRPAQTQLIIVQRIMKESQKAIQIRGDPRRGGSAGAKMDGTFGFRFSYSVFSSIFKHFLILLK